MKGKWTAAVAFGLMLVAFGPALFWRLRVQGGVDGFILSPAGERRVLALAILTALIPATALMVAAVRRTLRLWVVLPLVVLVLIGIAGGGALMTVLTDFIFPDRYLRTLAVEPQELHLYQGGFLGCSVKVYAAPHGATYARLVAAHNIDCANTETVSAHWQSDGGVEITGGGVETTPNLFFGPR